MWRAQNVLPAWMFFPVFFVFVMLSHITLLRLPYFWDESGYYIPAALDFYHAHALIPYTTLNTGHTPLSSVLLALWWRLSGVVPTGTRIACCMVTAFALTAVYRLARNLTGELAALIITLLTALYPVWFAQSTLAHSDLFAAAFTLWGLVFYFEGRPPAAMRKGRKRTLRILAALFFSLAVLSKETELITPFSLALWEIICLLRTDDLKHRRSSQLWLVTFTVPAVVLAGWCLYHLHLTGHLFGDSGYLRYNAFGTLTPQRIGLGLFYRALHLTAHMNLFVPVLCALAALLLVPLPDHDGNPRHGISPLILGGIFAVLLGHWIFFSVMGGALLTRYLLPAYPLVILLCVATWRRRVREWWLLSIFSAAAFLSGLVINPPYHFAPEDNLAYRDVVVLQQQAIWQIVHRYPHATVLTAWPASDELRKPELGYLRQPLAVYRITDFSQTQLELAAAVPEQYDTALLFSTKYDPPSLRQRDETLSTKYLEFHHDLFPAEAARLLHGTIVWQAERNGEWAAVLHFDRVVDARLDITSPSSVKSSF